MTQPIAQDMKKGQGCRWFVSDDTLNTFSEDGKNICKVPLIKDTVVMAVSMMEGSPDVFFIIPTGICRVGFSDPGKARAVQIYEFNFSPLVPLQKPIEEYIKFLHSGSFIVVSNMLTMTLTILEMTEKIVEDDFTDTFYRVVLEKTMSWKEFCHGFIGFGYLHEFNLFATVDMVVENNTVKKTYKFFDRDSGDEYVGNLEVLASALKNL